MGSTDSPGNTHNSSGSSCGLVSSLFPSSCRGRAEAFARRLHRRLTSLGGETNCEEDLTKPNESSWLHPASGIRTTPPTASDSCTTVATNRSHHSTEQQNKISSSPENDLYYDLSLDLDEDQTPGSPAEEATATEVAGLLVNSDSSTNGKNCEKCQDSDTSCNYASPINETSPESEESEVYFDPVSSDQDKKKETYYDLISTSESDNSTRLPNGINGFFCDNDGTSTEDSTESNCRLRLNKPHNCSLSPENSSNTKSSDTTSPSHESLWSDDSTVSIPEDSPTRTDLNLINSLSLPKSYSDFQLPSSTSDNLSYDNDENNDVDEVDFIDDGILKTDLSPIEEVTDSDLDSSQSNLPLPKLPDPSVNNEMENTDEEEGTANGVSEEKISRLLETLGGTYTDKTEEVMRMRENGIDDDEKLEQEDEEEESEEHHRPPRVRRCSSLKTGKTPPGTPGRKKIVRFADVLGLDLADVRTFLDEIPKVPNSAYSDLIYDDGFQKDSSPVNCGVQSWSNRYMDNTRSTSSDANQRVDRTLVPLFQQPGGLTTFLDTLRERRVCLENALVQDPVNLCIQGTVRVLNLDFHKSVHIRYTLNSWRNYSDLQATYIPNSCDGLSDKFTFNLYCHTLSVGQRIEFAVRFQCKGIQYWDNNSGANYCFQCLPTRSTSNYVPITSSASENSREWQPTFY